MYFSNISSVVFRNNFYSTFSSFPFGVPQGSVLSFFILFFIFLIFQELFHSILFKVNFMLLTLTPLLHFLKMNYLLLPLKFVLVSTKLFLRVILFSSNSILQNFSLYTLVGLLDPLNLFHHQTFHFFTSSTVHSLGFIFDFSIFLIPRIKSVAKSSFLSN